ncbi:MAG TPA: tyrosine-type recombinase/integrase [Saprospiraceae bacterium]|nr:tyrosine-type recombinase/integrase [Saprospiraceae bacterium]
MIKAYTSYLHQLGYADSSIYGRHKRSIKEFIDFMRKYGVQEWQQITVHHISDYLNYLRGRENKVVGGKLTEKTVYDQYRSLQLLYDLLAAKGRITINPTSQIEVNVPPRNQRRITVTESERKLLYESCKDDKGRAVLSLNYGCGLRVGELESLEMRDLKLDDAYLIVRKGKGNKRRAVPMSVGVINDLRNYLGNERRRLTAERHYRRNNQSVMLNEVGRPMKEWTFNKTLQTIAMRTENQDLINKRITTHIMRHSIATHLLHRGLDINQVRQFLGHVLLSTTQIYTHINNKQVLQI